MLHFIYVLKDPRTYAVRYVGMTIDLQRRYIAHLSNPTCETKYAWIRILTDMGLKPIMEVVERVEEGEHYARIREKYWIQHYIGQGATLLNTQLTIQIIGKKQREDTQHMRNVPHSNTRLWQVLDHFTSLNSRKKAVKRLLDFGNVRIEGSPVYSFPSLIDRLPCTRAQVSELLWIPEYALERMLAGHPVHITRIKYVLSVLSWVYSQDFSLQNVTGLVVREEITSHLAPM